MVVVKSISSLTARTPAHLTCHFMPLEENQRKKVIRDITDTKVV